MKLDDLKWKRGGKFYRAHISNDISVGECVVDGATSPVGRTYKKGEFYVFWYGGNEEHRFVSKLEAQCILLHILRRVNEKKQNPSRSGVPPVGGHARSAHAEVPAARGEEQEARGQQALGS